jgi:hypothetical protein
VVAAALVATAVDVVASRRDDGWSIDAPGSSNELVADDRTVCGTNQDDVVFCLDGADGDEISTTTWSSGARPSPSPTYSLDGEQLWSKRLGEVICSPIPPHIRGRSR